MLYSICAIGILHCFSFWLEWYRFDIQHYVIIIIPHVCILVIIIMTLLMRVMEVEDCKLQCNHGNKITCTSTIVWLNNQLYSSLKVV